MEKTGTVTSFDSSTGLGTYEENGKPGIQLNFEVPSPEVVIVPGELVTVLVATPSGRVVNIVREVGGRKV